VRVPQTVDTQPSMVHAVTADIEIIHLEIAPSAIASIDERTRNQFAGAMHAHNELTILNRLLMFSMNNTSDGELHDSAQSVQMWCLLQVLAGKLFESWNMLVDAG
jgi:hypothetical protein